MCPDHPVGGCFVCNECDGKFVSGTCEPGGLCTLDHIGPLP
jgi:hypothetical protein